MRKTAQKKGKMTLDKLALMVARGFAAVDERFSSVDTRLDSMDTRLDRVETDLTEVKQAVRRIDIRTQNQVDAVYSDMADLKKRVTALEQRKV